jgi:hypothetical protein
MSNARAIWGRVRKSKAAGKKSEFIRDGKYIFGVLQIISKVSTESGLNFIARLLVLKAESKGDLDPKTKAPVVPNPVGSVVGYVQQLDAYPKTAPGNVKAFMLSLGGMSESDGDAMTEVDLGDGKKVQMSNLEVLGEGASGPDQLARGMLIACSTRQGAVKSGKNAGNINTYPQFDPVSEATDATEFGGNNDADVARRRAEWDKDHPVEELEEEG